MARTLGCKKKKILFSFCVRGLGRQRKETQLHYVVAGVTYNAVLYTSVPETLDFLFCLSIQCNWIS